MQITEELRGETAIIRLSGRLDSNTAPDLEAILPGPIAAGNATIVDFGEVSYVSSAGLRVLLKGAKLAKTSGIQLILAGLSPSVREVFDISGFTSIFSIEPDTDAALVALG